MKPYPLQFIRVFFILSIFFFSIQQIHAQADTKKGGMYLCYFTAGLGANFGSYEPKIKIQGNILYYTKEQTSFWDKKDPHIDSMYKTAVTQASIDSIVDYVKDLKDTIIRRANICILSGGIHYLTIANNKDTTSFSMHNTFDTTAFKIVSIINNYLPDDKKIYASLEMIKREEDCSDWLKRASNKESR